MKSISVAIPTYNGISYLKELIPRLLSQQEVYVEVLIIDSTSTDGTWEFLNKYPEVTKIQIPKTSFSHGGTRHQLVLMAKSEIVVFLSQDALPMDEFWAASIYNTFNSLPKEVAALLGSQEPRLNAHPAIAQRIIRTFSGLGNQFAISIYQSKNYLINRNFGSQPLKFLSDVHVAYRKNVIALEVPFENVDYAEDQLMAKNLLNHGYDIAYAGFIRVWHSNEINASKYAERVADEIIGSHKNLNNSFKLNAKFVIREFFKNIFYDVIFIIKNKNKFFGPKSRIKAFVLIPIYEIQSVRGFFLANKALNKP